MRRAEIALALLVPLGLGAALFPNALLGRKALSSSDLLYRDLPLRASAPAGFRPGNSTLYDPAYYLEPWMHFAVEEVRSGRLPLWNPYASCGTPLLGNAQAAFFSPFTLLHYVFPGPWATV